MSDVRALLKAKRQEARISHPLASYSTSGQLRCAACGTTVKHASAWSGHLGSKTHRIHAARLREAERTKEAEKEEEKVRGKRKAEDDLNSGFRDEPKKPRVGATALDAGGTLEPPASNGFPADFFSDTSRTPLPPASDDSDDENEHQNTVLTGPPQNGSPLDMEWEKFQQSVLNAPDHRETYERATTFAEPELASETPEGFPAQQAEDADEQTAPSQINEEEVRRKKETDERELIMDRLLDEERAQEEADMKVSIMKERLQALKQRREAAKSKRLIVGDD